MMPYVNVCLTTKPRNPTFARRTPVDCFYSLGIHGTRDEVIHKYKYHMDSRQRNGILTDESLMEFYDKVEPCACPGGKSCTTQTLNEILEKAADRYTDPYAYLLF